MNKTIPYGLHDIDKADVEAVVAALLDESITQGPLSDIFGNKIAEFVGSKYGFGVSSGTAALHIACAALGLGPGDEVITTAMSFCATSNAIEYVGSTPVFVDIDPKSLNLDVKLVKNSITERTKAIIAVDFRGVPAELVALREICDQHGLFLIHDCAQSLGSKYWDGKKFVFSGCCDHADISCFSFHPVKHITTGEGGVVVTNNESLARSLNILRKHGIDRREEMFDEKRRIGSWFYEMESLGFNYRLTDFQAALGLSQLNRLPYFIERRKHIKALYDQLLEDIEHISIIPCPPGVETNLHIYCIVVEENQFFDRYDLFEFLRRHNYRLMVLYRPIPDLLWYRNKYGSSASKFSVSRNFYDKSLAIPFYPSLSDLECFKIVNLIKKYVSNKA